MKPLILDIRAVDPDPHGSAFIFPPIIQYADPDPGGEN